MKKRERPAQRGGRAESFDNGATWQVLWSEVAPGLERAARLEFETVLGGTDVQAQEIKDVRRQGELMKRFLCAYVDGLVELHCIHGTALYGDRSAQEELHAHFGGQRNQLWYGSLKHISDALRQIFPKRVISDRL